MKKKLFFSISDYRMINNNKVVSSIVFLVKYEINLIGAKKIFYKEMNV